MTDEPEKYHPSVPDWPIPHRLSYPRDQRVRCAYCGEEGIRTILNRGQGRNLWFCTPEHRTARRVAINAGDDTAFDPASVSPGRYAPNWSNLGLGPRKDIDDIPSPTKWDIEHGRKR